MTLDPLAAELLRLGTHVSRLERRQRSAGSGGGGGVTDHGLLTGLGDDDHPQYLRPAEVLAGTALTALYNPDGTVLLSVDTASLPPPTVPNEVVVSATDPIGSVPEAELWWDPDASPAPFSGGGGLVTSQRITFTSVAFAGTEVALSGITAVWTADPGRRYKIGVTGLLQSTVAADVVFLRLRLGSVTGTQVGGVNHLCAVSTHALTFTGTTFVSGLSGSQTAVLTGQRAAGTGNITQVATATAPTWLWVEDMGPGAV